MKVDVESFGYKKPSLGLSLNSNGCWKRIILTKTFKVDFQNKFIKFG